MQVKEFDVTSDISGKIHRDPQDFLNMFDGSVGREVAKCSIVTKLSVRRHKFKNGEMGDIANRLTIVIDFGESIIQPHSCFEDDFATLAVDALANNVNGLFENSYEASEDGELEEDI